jgi:sec-independent protein translocase protein TatA
LRILEVAYRDVSAYLLYKPSKMTDSTPEYAIIFSPLLLLVSPPALFYGLGSLGIEVDMLGIGLPELLLIMVLALLVLGPQRLPEVARMVGRAYAQLRRASEDFQNTIRQDIAALERQEDAQRNKAVRDELRERFADLEGVQTTIKERDVHG